VKSNNAEAKEFVKDYFQYESVYIEEVWPSYRFLVVLPQTLIVVFEDQATWMMKNRLTDATEVPNYLDYIYMDALEQVKPDAVTIIR